MRTSGFSGSTVEDKTSRRTDVQEDDSNSGLHLKKYHGNSRLNEFSITAFPLIFGL